MRRPVSTALAASAVLVLLTAWLVTSAGRGTGHGGSEGDRPAASDAGADRPELTASVPEGGTRPAPADAEPTPPWAITGRVLDPESTPVSGARVRAIAARGHVRDEISSVRSDATGSFRLDLAPLARAAPPVRGTVVLALVAEAEGYLGSSETLYVCQDSPTTPIEFDLHLSMGGTVRGRVVDQAGTPLPAASAGVLYTGERGNAHDFVYTQPDGSFDVTAALPGPCVAEAEWGGHRARSPAFEVRSGAVVDSLELVVPVTAEFIEGVVVRPDGTPAPQVEVALWDEDPRESDYSHVVALTDDAGRFRFAVPGETTWYVGVETRSPRDPIPCRAGGAPIRVTIPPCRLVVRVVTEDGTPLPGAGVAYMAWRAEDRAARDGLLAGTSTREEAALRALAEGWSEIPAADGTGTSYVDADTVWFFSAGVMGGVAAEATLDIGASIAEATVTLTVPEKLPSAALALTCLRPDGSQLDAWRADVRTLGGSLLHELRPATPPGPLTLPAGHVRVRVEPDIEPTWSDGALPPDSFLLPAERTVEIPAGARHSLRLPMQAGGRFRVSVAPDGRSRAAYGPADIQIRTRAGSKEQTRAVTDWVFVDGERPWWDDQWAPGTTAVSAKPLAPGDYILSVRHNALKPYEASIRIEAREITNVILAWDD